jgi:hypothetical protein
VTRITLNCGQDRYQGQPPTQEGRITNTTFVLPLIRSPNGQLIGFGREISYTAVRNFD